MKVSVLCRDFPGTGLNDGGCFILVKRQFLSSRMTRLRMQEIHKGDALFSRPGPGRKAALEKVSIFTLSLFDVLF